MSEIVILNGPSGAGKSTTAKAFLEQAEGTWAYVCQDDMRDLVKKGYRSANGMPDTWDAEVKNQMSVSIPLCADMVRRYAEYGINCVLDLYAEADDFTAWQQALQDIEYTLFVLLPDLESTLLRNQERSGTARLTDEKIAYNHGNFVHANWPSDTTIIDTSKLTVNEVVQKIRALA